jgi:hypothetical protein
MEMKNSWRKTIAFISALTLTAAPLSVSASALSAFALESSKVQSDTASDVEEATKLKPVQLGTSPFSIMIPDAFFVEQDPQASDIENGMFVFYKSDYEGHGIGIFQQTKAKAGADTLKDYADSEAAKYSSTAKKGEFNGIEVYSYDAVKEYKGTKFDTTTYIFESDGTFVEVAFWPKDDKDAAGAVKSMESLKKNYASADKLCEMVIKDYEAKTGITAASAAIAGDNHDGTVDIVLKDADGNSLATYKIDPETATGTDSRNNDADLPQTGMSGLHKSIAGMAALMGVVGTAFVIKSRKEDEEE